MTPTSARVCSGGFVNAPPLSDSTSSIARLVRYLRQQFLRSRMPLHEYADGFRPLPARATSTSTSIVFFALVVYALRPRPAGARLPDIAKRDTLVRRGRTIHIPRGPRVVAK